MAAERSDKCPFPSSYGGGFLSAGQYLAEFMTVRQARRDKAELPQKFWNSPGWKRKFLNQLNAANKLLADFDVQVILRALRSAEGRQCLSLGVAWLGELVGREQAKAEQTKMRFVNSARDNPALPPSSGVAEPPRPAFAPRESLLSRLRQL